jgi:hypothetical protein
MTDHGAPSTAGTYRPSPDNVDLLQEALWIAEQTKVLRKPRQPGGVWEPDLDALGDAIGRTSGAFKALKSGGDPELLTLRKLLAYAVERIPGYNSIRFVRACRLLYEDHLSSYLQGLAAEDAAGEASSLIDQIAQEEGLSLEDLQATYRVHRVVFRALDALMRDQMRQRLEGRSARPPNTEQGSAE